MRKPVTDQTRARPTRDTTRTVRASRPSGRRIGFAKAEKPRKEDQMSRTLYIVAGIVSLIAGVLALFDPFGATFAATLIAGWGFILFALLQFVAAFQAAGWGGRIWSFLLGILAAIVGVRFLQTRWAGWCR